MDNEPDIEPPALPLGAALAGAGLMLILVVAAVYLAHLAGQAAAGLFPPTPTTLECPHD